ncbi:MAG: hypothetical protein IJZ53_13735 [Tyzzerella sp.]|nr:hypothetical protein [Tyzzerella sp.]
MKLMRKVATMLLCICLAVPCFSMISHADEGTIRFNDPTVKVGETVDVKINMKTPGSVEKVDLTLSYDPTLLKFVGGDMATETAEGTVQYVNPINWASFSGGFNFSLKFQALKAGTATIEIEKHNIISGESVTWELGTSKVVITKADGTTVADPVEDPDTTEPDAENPDAEPSDDTTAGAEINISNSTTITLIDDVSSVILPERYVETTVTVNEQEFTAWQDSEDEDLYILYATSSTGETSLYRYDTLENTYQRFTPTETEEEGSGLEKILGIFGEKAEYVVFGAGAVLLIFVILIIVLSVKLYNRNAELDELYDEYGIDLDDEEENNKKAKYETEDDVVLVADEEDEDLDEEDDPEVEVEFFVEESIKDFFGEDKEGAGKEEAPVENTAKPQMEASKESAEDSGEFYDDEEAFYDDLDSSFMVDFIDLDD